MQREIQKQIEQDHLRAMKLTDEALSARRNNDPQTAIQYFHAAFEAERQAAEALFAIRDMEPTRSILFRSAGLLALDCGEMREAERMAAAGLAGNPPADVATELRNLIKRVNSHRSMNHHNGVIEVTETAEAPVVSRETRVVHEVVVGKQATDFTEMVHDTVRHTDVEVEQIAGQTTTTGMALNNMK